jgi:Cdc6-like AAA superfamily ATPase
MSQSIPLKAPKNPASLFTGREMYIQKLKEFFDPKNHQGHLTRSSFLLYGMGGIGKTQICLKFIEQAQDW